MIRIGSAPPSDRRGIARWSLPAVVVAVALAACGPSATATPTSATPSETASPSVAPPVSVTPTPAASFACTRLPYVHKSGSLSVRVADVRVAQHAGYDRIVYEFRAGKLPAIDIRVVEPPFELDPSGLPVAIDGTSFVRIKLTQIAVETVPSGADDVTPGYPLLTELRQIAGYEGDATWIAGFSGPVCVHAYTPSSPARLVIDIRSEAP
jgi:hypothetical protein